MGFLTVSCRLRAWVAVGALGFVLSAAQAVLRPNFQVSDEVAYFAGAQWGAIVATERRAALEVAPPTGQYVHEPPSGKPLWQASAGRVLAQLAPQFGPGPSVVAFRLLGCLSVALAAALTVGTARRLLGNEPVALAAGVLVASHAGFAAHAAAMTPDLAVFGLGALTTYLGVRAREAPAARRLVTAAGILMLTGVAFALKDTGVIAGLPVLFLVPPPPHTRAPWQNLVLLVLGASVVLTSVSAGLPSGGPHLAAQVPSASPADLPRQAANLLVTFWTSVGNFGANELPLPASVRVLALVTSSIAGLGIVRIAAGRRGTVVDRTALATAAVVALAACAPSIARWQVVAHTDVLQAKWVFPAMPVFAILTIQGLSAWTSNPARALPLLAVLAVGSNVLFLAGCLIPFYYEALPVGLRVANLYLGGSYGTGTDPAIVRTFIVAPEWLAPWPAHLAGLAVLGVVVLAMACVLWEAHVEATAPPPRDEVSGPAA